MILVDSDPVAPSFWTYRYVFVTCFHKKGLESLGLVWPSGSNKQGTSLNDPPLTRTFVKSTCCKRWLSSLGPPPQGEGVQICPPHPLHGGVPWVQKWRVSLMGVQGYQRFPLFKPVVGHNIALHTVPAYRASTYLVSAFNFIFPKFLQSSTVECVLSSELYFFICGRKSFCFTLIWPFVVDWV